MNSANLLSGPHSIAFDITNRCNLRCLHCFNSSGENDVMLRELDDDTVLSAMKSFCNLHLYSFCFCGGEALLRKNVVLQALHLLTESGIKCNLVSNGLLADQTTLNALCEAGLRGIQFSIDGQRDSHDRMRGLPGLFNRVLDAVNTTLSSTTLHVSVAFCPTSFNIPDFEPLCTILRNLLRDAGRQDRIDIRVQPLMLLGRARRNPDIRPTVEQYRNLVHTINRLRFDPFYRGWFTFEWGDPIDHLIRYPTIDSEMDQISIHANGDIVASPYIPLIVGNIQEHTIEEYYAAGLGHIWNKAVVRTLANRMHSIDEMETVSSLIADVNMKEDLRIDLIDDDLDDLSILPPTIRLEVQ